jgi:hypothetical protein
MFFSYRDKSIVIAQLKNMHQVYGFYDYKLAKKKGQLNLIIIMHIWVLCLFLLATFEQ